jgi:hypothetical protein
MVMISLKFDSSRLNTLDYLFELENDLTRRIESAKLGTYVGNEIGPSFAKIHYESFFTDDELFDFIVEYIIKRGLTGLEIIAAVDLTDASRRVSI